MSPMRLTIMLLLLSFAMDAAAGDRVVRLRYDVTNPSAQPVSDGVSEQGDQPRERAGVDQPTVDLVTALGGAHGGPAAVSDLEGLQAQTTLPGAGAGHQ